MKIDIVIARQPAAARCLPFAAAVLALSLAGPASALEFECNKTDDQRFIHVDMPGESHLCDVSVDYPGGKTRVLWYADHDTLFCSAKAYELRDKYRDLWNFECTTWPDRDGIDQLSARNRYILDNQLKALIARLERAATNAGGNGGDAEGNTDEKTAAAGERVVSIKTAVSESGDDQPGTLAVQYFIGPDDDSHEVTRDITQVIVDTGNRWRVIARIDLLARQIDTTNGVEVDSAIITGVTENGLLKVDTAVTGKDGSTSSPPACQGEQFFTVSSGKPQPQGPHRLLCGDSLAGTG